MSDSYLGNAAIYPSLQPFARWLLPSVKRHLAGVWVASGQRAQPNWGLSHPFYSPAFFLAAPSVGRTSSVKSAADQLNKLLMLWIWQLARSALCVWTAWPEAEFSEAPVNGSRSGDIDCVARHSVADWGLSRRICNNVAQSVIRSPSNAPDWLPFRHMASFQSLKNLLSGRCFHSSSCFFSLTISFSLTPRWS